MTISRVLVVLAALTLSGCNSPARWAEKIDLHARCGMSVEDVERLTSHSVETVVPPRGWATHVIRVDQTEVWLGFSDGRLQWLQVAWAIQMQRMATYQKVDLCGLAAGDPFARQPLPQD